MCSLNVRNREELGQLVPNVDNRPKKNREAELAITGGK